MSLIRERGRTGAVPVGPAWARRRVAYAALVVVVLLGMVPALGRAAPGGITTVAGGGVGDGGPGPAAALREPHGVAVDAAGHLFIADFDNHRIRRVDAGTGVITTVAGTGSAGFGGDGGPAPDATLRFPEGVAVDATGHLFIVGNDRIRRVDAGTGVITTVAGTGNFGFSGDGGPATAAALQSPSGVAVDAAGHLFIADRANSRIRRVDAGTGVITTVAGTGSFGFSGDGGPATTALLSGPSGVAVDAAGHLFIADSGNARIRRVDTGTGVITTVAGTGSFGFSGDGGPASAAALNSPTGVAVDAAGHLFIADGANSRIRRVDAGTGVITTVAGGGGDGDGGPATDAALSFPVDVAVDATGHFFIADRFNHRIRRVDAGTGVITTVAGTGSLGFGGDGGPAPAAALDLPTGVTVDTAGHFFIADYFNHRIRRVDAGTGVITTVAGTGVLGFGGDGGPAPAAALNSPQRVAVDAAGHLFIADTGNSRIRRVDAGTGVITTVAGGGGGGDGGPATAAALGQPLGVAVDLAGHLFIAGNSRIRRVDAGTGVITTVAGTESEGFSGDGGPALAAALNLPTGVAVDATGHLFFADTNNYRIRRVDAGTGVITTVAGTGSQGFSGDGGPAPAAALWNPTGVVVDAAGHLFIADTTNNRIRRVDAGTGVITTVAGTGSDAFGGDGGPATAAALWHPTGVVVDAAGHLFIADTTNNRIRRVESPGTFCGNGVVDGGEACDPGIADSGCCSPACEIQTAGTVCRAVANVCDLEEVCMGASAACPVDVFASASTVCRPSGGVCDVAENCTGVNVNCPADAKSSAVCRAAAGVCDIAETCDGVNNACPTDAFASSATICRGAAGVCDLAENCTGSGAACPADAFQSSATMCRASAGVCDTAENCTGSGPACPADAFASSATVCRAAAGVCDALENCTGSSPPCPADGFASSATTCRPSVGVCDVAENCTGSSPTCPADAFASSPTVCRPSSGVCDVAENCTGTSAACPADTFASSPTVCRPSSGVCDVAENCTGMSAACPADTFASAAMVCRPSSGTCDVAENCTGASASCPPDVGRARAAARAARADADTPQLADAKRRKAAVKCQQTIATVSAKVLQGKLAALDACANAALACVQTKGDKPGCADGAAKTCVKKLTAAAAAVGKAKQKLLAAKSCTTELRLSDLLAEDGLGLADTAGVCDAAFALDVCSGGYDALAQCLVQAPERAAGRLYGATRPRAGELLERLPVTLPAVDGLPTFAGCEGCIAIGNRKAIEACGTALTKAQRALATKLGSTFTACAAGVFACAQTGKPGCTAKATAKCSAAEAKVAAAVQKFATAVVKKCAAATIGFAELAAPAGLNVTALEDGCDTLDVSTLASIGDVATCLERRTRCVTAELLQHAVGRTSAFASTGHLGTLGDDLGAVCPAGDATTETSAAPAAAVAPRAIAFGGITKLLTTVSRAGIGGITRPGAPPPPTPGVGPRVTVTGPARVVFGAVRKVVITYRSPARSVAARARAAEDETSPTLLVAVQGTGAGASDYFEVPLDPAPAGEAGDAVLELAYQDDLPGCFTLVFAVSEGGQVSDYAPLLQVVDPESDPCE